MQTLSKKEAFMKRNFSNNGLQKQLDNYKALTLKDYKPKEFGNKKIDLTIDGGQHLRSPGDDEPPRVTYKNVQSIFRDPIFDHKEAIVRLEQGNRNKLLEELQNKIMQR